MGRLKYFLKRILLGVILFILILFAWFGGYRLIFSNSQLATSNSFYLKQHKNDLVKWNIWSEDTISLAKKENKPLFISIGFSASLWDVILQEKSFKNPFTAKMINRYFVPVLVDRHQSRFVDKLYTELMVYQTSRSGWPMIIMATPDGIPLFLTTFLRNEELQVALQRISYDWRQNSASTQKLADNWSKGFSNAQQLSKYKKVTSLNDYFQVFIKNNADETYGGLKENNKFTYLRQYSVLFNLGLVPLNHVKKTISELLTSPLFDFVEGGVHRYSFGPDWSKPQTEKMFIDQVYFIRLLIQLYNKTGDNLYSEYAKYNLDFILKSFFNKKSGEFYPSLNSGTGKKTGYYMFSNAFLDEISPLKFYRVQYTKKYSGVSLVQPIDLFAIDKSVLRKYRKNRPIQLVPDTFFSIPDHVEFLKMLDLYDNTFKTQYARIYSPLILKQFELELSKPQNLNNLLYMYDVFSMTGNDEILESLKLLIASNISDVFPYDVNQFSLNEHLLNPDYIDQYSYNQSIYFLLAYFNELNLPFSKDTMCSEIEDKLVLPWNQLSYVDSLIQFCL